MTILAPIQTKRAAIYPRVSTTGQEEEGTSLATQEARCREYAAQQGYEVDEGHVYREVHTGTELWERPQLTRLRDAVRRRQVDVVIAYAIDRLSRDPVHLGVIISEADHAGAAVEFVTEPLDNSPEGQLIRFVRGYAAKVEHEKIKERTIRGRKARAEKGYVLPGCRPLYGYRFNSDRTMLEIDPATGAVVRRIYELALAGHPLRAIAAQLTNEGIPPPTGRKGYWSFATIRAILTHPSYTGAASAWRYQTTKVNGKRIWAIRPASQQVELPEGTIPRLIDPPVFEAVAQRLKLNKERAIRNNRDPEASLLRGGYVRCGYCSYAMIVCGPFRAGSAPIYRCGRPGADAAPCAHGITTTILDKAVWEKVTTIFMRPDIIAEELDRLQRKDPTPIDLAIVDRSLADVDRQQRNLVNQLANLGDAVARVVGEKLTALERQREQLLVEREKVLAQQRIRREARDKLKEIERWCRTVAVNLANLTYDEKRLALDGLGVQVRVWKADHIDDAGEPLRFEITASIPLREPIVFRTGQGGARAAAPATNGRGACRRRA